MSFGQLIFVEQFININILNNSLYRPEIEERKDRKGESQLHERISRQKSNP